MNTLPCILLLGLLCLPLAAQAEMYKCATASGQTAYQDTPCASAKETVKVMPSPRAREEGDPLEAAASVFAMDYLLDKMAGWCASRAPASTPAVQQARAAWRERHRTLSEKSRQILQVRLNEDERAGLLILARRENDKIMERLTGVDPASAQQMCNELPGKMAAPQLDLTTHGKLVKTLTSYPDR